MLQVMAWDSSLMINICGYNESQIRRKKKKSLKQWGALFHIVRQKLKELRSFFISNANPKPSKKRKEKKKTK
jgi:uncharacterized protein (UPF0128 family)